MMRMWISNNFYFLPLLVQNEDFKAAYARFISAFSLSRKEMTNEEKNNPEYTRLLEVESSINFLAI